MANLALLAMILGAVIMVYPYAYTVGSSFKTRREFVEDKEFGSKFENLISKHDILITRNHGYYTVGKTAAEAFFRAYYLEQACSVQVKNLAMGLNKHEIDKQKAAYFWENMSDSDDYNYDGKTEWAALLRKLEREHSNYKN